MYHLTYHFSISLHINHLCFLQSYLLAAFTVLHSFGLAVGSDTVATVLPVALGLALAAYTVRLGGFLCAVPYCAVIGGIVYSATEFAAPFFASHPMGAVGGDGNGDDKQVGSAAAVALGGLALMLSSFMVQLAGHAAFEVYQSPLDLMHGFFAAPPLEWLALLARVERLVQRPLFLPDSVTQDVWKRVAELRSNPVFANKKENAASSR